MRKLQNQRRGQKALAFPKQDHKLAPLQEKSPHNKKNRLGPG